MSAQQGVTFDDVLHALDGHGCKPTKRGSGYTALCPAHDDHSPSLDIDERNGKVLTICRSHGCSFESILDALGLKGIGYEPQPTIPYHVRKKVKVHAPAYLDKDNLIIPLIDMNGVQRGTQTIWAEPRTVDGKLTDKLTKGKGKNEYFFLFGNVELSDSILIATGYATTASIHESTSSPAVMSMDDGSLPHTVSLFRNRYPEKEIIICCDYDAVGKMKPVAVQHNARLCYPVMDGMPKADFNDLMVRSGKAAVCDVVGDARFVACSESPTSGLESPTSDAAAKDRERPVEPTESVILRSAASIVPCAIEWLWPGWLSVGKLHLLAGSPGTAKTTIALDWSAAISRGGKMPDGSTVKQGTVLIWSSEDDPRDTLAPRLIAAGADMSKIHIVEAVNHNRRGKRAFDPAKDFPLLRSAAHHVGNVTFMLIDSISDAVSGDGAKNNQVRRALSPVKEFAEEMRICTLGISHFNKNVNGKIISRIIDSVAFVGLPRVVMVAFKKRGNGSLIMRAKSNIGPDEGGYEYSTYMEPLPGYEGITANRIGWGAYVTGTADDHLKDAESTIVEPENERERAEQFLQDLFADGFRRESAEVDTLARSHGISKSTLERARDKLRMKPKKINGVWWLYTPGSKDEPS